MLHYTAPVHCLPHGLLLRLQPTLRCLCHVAAVAMDFDNRPGVACSLPRHTSCTFFWFEKMRSEVSGLVAVFFFNQDLWSWILAILPENMPSLLIHLLNTLEFSLFVWVMTAGFPANAGLLYPG